MDIFINKINKKSFFIIVFLFFNIISWGYLIFYDNSAISRYFITTANFSDFFTPLKKSLEDAYIYPHYSNYPALANLLFIAIKKCSVSVNYDDFISDTTINIIFLIFISFSILFIFELGKNFLKTDSIIINKICILLILLSGPFLYLYSRSNILLLVIVLCMFFIQYYDSQNKILKELALIALAFATAIKIYPVIFGILLIRKHNAKVCIRAIIYGIIIFFGPFLIYGIETIPLFFENLILRDTSTSYNYVLNHAIGIKSAIQIIGGILLNKIIWKPLTFFWILALLSMLYVFCVSKEKWKRYFALSMLCIWGFNGSYLYNLCFLIIPLLYFLDEKACGKLDYIYSFFFIILFSTLFLPEATTLNILLDINNLGHVSWAIVIVNIILLIMALLLVIETTIKLKKKPVKKILNSIDNI